MSKNYFEAVEMCPFCESENTYPMWDVNTKGYTVKWRFNYEVYSKTVF